MRLTDEDLFEGFVIALEARGYTVVKPGESPTPPPAPQAHSGHEVEYSKLLPRGTFHDNEATRMEIAGELGAWLAQKRPEFFEFAVQDVGASDRWGLVRYTVKARIVPPGAKNTDPGPFHLRDAILDGAADAISKGGLPPVLPDSLLRRALREAAFQHGRELSDVEINNMIPRLREVVA